MYLYFLHKKCFGIRFDQVRLFGESGPSWQLDDQKWRPNTFVQNIQGLFDSLVFNGSSNMHYPG